MKRIVQSILVCQLPLLFILFIWNPTTARGEINRSKVVDGYHEMVRETEVLKILSVLEKKMGDKKSLEKAKEKLLALKDLELALITSLSEQITKERERPGADIAFLLITALIILS